VQYQLALGRRRFLAALAVGAALEPVVLLGTGVTDLEAFAAIVLAVQATTAAVMLYSATRAAARTSVPAKPPIGLEAGGRSNGQSPRRSSRRKRASTASVRRP
jgi:hypothetical protein